MHKRVLIEGIEGRRLLSAPVQIVPIHAAGCACCSGNAVASGQLQDLRVDEETEAEAQAGLSAKINFQTPSSTTPSGYLPDTGKSYRSQNGFSYGWKTDNSSKTRDRNASNSPDQRYDTLNHFPTSQKWELAVPTGYYSVHLVAGDPSYTDSVFKFALEGKTILDARPAGENYWVERTMIVSVTDGRLTLSTLSGAQNAKVSFIDVQGVSGPLKVTDKITWSKQTDGRAPISRVESGVVQLGNKLYVMGGYTNGYGSTSTRVDVLNMSTRTWSTAASLPGSQTHAGAATDGQYIYWVAGQYGPLFSTQGTNESWRYDPSTNQWSRFVNLPQVRFGGGLTYVDGFLHFFGGDDATRNVAQADHWKLDLSDPTPQWTAAAPMPFPGDHLSHAVVGDKIFVMGGEYDHGNTYVQHNYTFRYNTASDTWTRLADMPTPKSHFEASTLVINNKIYAIAGQVDHELLTAESAVYDIAANKWTLGTPFPEKRKGVAAGIFNNKIYLSGGDSFQNGQPRDLWIGTLG
jgi:N-acetylneuraminic acid mutarotase